MPSERAVPGPDRIPLSVPCLPETAWTYVRDCLDTNWVSSAGAYVDRFERMVAERAGLPYGIATVNGTAALHVALLIAGVEHDDAVIVPALTFIASANAVCYCGAWPMVIDVDPLYRQLDPEKLAEFLGQECVLRDGALRHRASDRRIRAIMPVHLLGHPCDMAAIVATARRYGIPVVEDATEGLGASHHGTPVGSAGDIACYSFNGNKIITTGGGGVVVTANAAWAERCRYLTTQAKDDPVEGIHNAVGFNYRMPNLNAALGMAQLERLDDYVARKRDHAAYYRTALADLPGVSLPQEAPWAASTFWLYTVDIDAARLGFDRRALSRELSSRGIETRPLWQPLHRSPALAGAVSYRVEVADRMWETALSLPSSVGLSDQDRERVADEIVALCRDAAVAR